MGFVWGSRADCLWWVLSWREGESEGKGGTYQAVAVGADCRRGCVSELGLGCVCV